MDLSKENERREAPPQTHVYDANFATARVIRGTSASCLLTLASGSRDNDLNLERLLFSGATSILRPNSCTTTPSAKVSEFLSLPFTTRFSNSLARVF